MKEQHASIHGAYGHYGMVSQWFGLLLRNFDPTAIHHRTTIHIASRHPPHLRDSKGIFKQLVQGQVTNSKSCSGPGTLQQ